MMANLVLNKIVMTENDTPISVSNPSLLNEIRNFVGSPFDFNNIVPQTEESMASMELDNNPSAWYGWRVLNWGTSLEPTDVSETENGWTMKTGWSTPYLIIKSLSSRYPTVTFTVEYADESLGDNCGTYTVINEQSNVTVGDYIFACSVWGIEPTIIE